MILTYHWPKDHVICFGKFGGIYQAQEGLAFFPAQKMPIYLIKINLKGLLVLDMNL